jgi:hypothetical protein
MTTSKPGILTSILLALLLISVETNPANSKMIWGWFIILLLVSVVRFWLLTHYQHSIKSNNNSTHNHLRNIRIGTLLSGALWGAVGIIIFASNDFEHIIFLIFVTTHLPSKNGTKIATA